jgi:hypothetical protein
MKKLFNLKKLYLLTAQEQKEQGLDGSSSEFNQMTNIGGKFQKSF